MNGIKQAGECSCYFCFRQFSADEIVDVCDGGRTALCPHCEMDTLLPGAIEDGKLEQYHIKAFKLKD